MQLEDMASNSLNFSHRMLMWDLIFVPAGSPAHNILIFEAFTKFLLGLVGDTSKFLRIKNGKRSFDVSFSGQEISNYWPNLIMIFWFISSEVICLIVANQISQSWGPFPLLPCSLVTLTRSFWLSTPWKDSKEVHQNYSQT